MMRRFSFLFILLAGIMLLSCGGGNDDDANIINPPVVTDPDTTKTDGASVQSLELADSGYINSYLVLKSVSVEYFDVRYYSVALPVGKVKVSGRIYISKDCMTSKSVKGIVLADHYTITKESQCPTEDTNYYESMFATLGYAVVVPDYYGFGVTKDYPQTYLCEETTARQCLDMVKQTQNWLKKRKIDTAGKVYNIGYSQGGAVAMAVQRRAEAEGMTIDKTYAGAGPYDVDGTYTYMEKHDDTGIPAVVPLMLIGMNYAYKLNLDLPKIFKEPLASNYADWVNSKNYTVTEINHKIGTSRLSNMLQPEFLDSTSAANISFRKMLKANSLISGWTAKAKTPIYLFHSTEDDIVPTLNTYEMEKKLRADGYTDKNLTVETLPWGTHSTALLAFYLKCYYDLMDQ
jgi:dienelactone hydrolase